MRPVVCDAGPIIHLEEAKILNLLSNLGEIYVPEKVVQEVINHLPQLKFSEKYTIVKLSAEQKKTAQTIEKFNNLQAGESEAIILAKEKPDCWLITDDASARVISGLHNIETHGSLGIVLWNITHGFISKQSGLMALHGLRKSSLWLSDQIWETALKKVKEMSEL